MKVMGFLDVRSGSGVFDNHVQPRLILVLISDIIHFFGRHFPIVLHHVSLVVPDIDIEKRLVLDIGRLWLSFWH
jgi:hypothetical protein